MKVILWQQWIGTVSPHPEATLDLLEMALVLRDCPHVVIATSATAGMSARCRWP